MTKIISVFIIVLLIYGGWELWSYWEKISNEKEAEQKQAAAITSLDPRSLPGMPDGYEPTLTAAQRGGGQGLKKWLQAYGKMVEDPRRAWIELDYVVMIAREDPKEAKRVFADVKERVPASSPVYPRIKQLEKTYQ